MATWNSNQSILDAVESTYITTDDWEANRAANRKAMREMATPEVVEHPPWAALDPKGQANAALKERAPSQVQIDPIPHILGPPKSPTPRGDQIRHWAGAVPSATQPDHRTKATTPILKTTAPTPSTVPDDPSVAKLLSVLIDKFDHLQSGLEKGQQAMMTKMRESPQPRLSTEAVATPEEAAGTKKKSAKLFYAIAKGRETGVFTSWHKVLKLVRGYPGAVHKRFRQEDDAHAWLSERLDPSEDGGLTDDETFVTCIEPNDDTIPTGINFESPLDSVQPVPINQPTERILDVTKIGPDTSAGNSQEVFGTSIQVEPEVLKTLCPKGVLAPVRKELMDSAVDVTSLPGKYNASKQHTDGTLIMDQFAEAVGEMTSSSGRRTGETRTRDTQWRLSGKNALDKIKTSEDLADATEEISSMMGTALANMNSAFRETLYNAGWTTTDADLWVTAGLLPRLARNTMQWWLELHIHLQKIANANPEHWDEVVLPHLLYHSKCLARIRKWALTRTMLILQSYIYLRDGRSKGFQDIKLLSDLTTRLQRATLQGVVKPNHPKAQQWSCSHCHSDLHEGGKPACPMGDLKPKVARRIAKNAARQIKTDPDALDKAVAEEKQNPSE